MSSVSVSFRSDFNISPSDIETEGTSTISQKGLRVARSRGQAIKLIARASLGNGELRTRVAPVSIPDSHPLANVKDQENALLVTFSSPPEGQGPRRVNAATFQGPARAPNPPSGQNKLRELVNARERGQRG